MRRILRPIDVFFFSIVKQAFQFEAENNAFEAENNARFILVSARD